MLLSIIYYIIVIPFLIVYAVFISVVWALTVWWDRRKTIISATTYLHAMMLFWPCFRWKIKVEGRKNFDRSQPYVIICNHQGMFDIPLLYAIHANMRWVAKKELLKMPFVGHAMLIHGDITIERGDAISARHMFGKGIKELKRGVNIAMFPEGTRLKTGKINRFKEGGFLLAKNADVAILPVVLDGTADAFRGWRLVMPHTFRLKVLPVIPVETVRSNTPKQTSEIAREIILKAHKEMRPDLYMEE